ncbi:acyl-CoA dehydrogenase [Cordyceps javanica]|uniref:Acyl-CoA dehydrogenase n=1 Tax=Cordyceps javanica TaxID=43265 RepID=A0A545WD53_9HYPO|nr:acyl-CoA dehydrogenase [Cordyceps javanica]TQW11914.1 acyl-CoA dehydrogenase [Cordyceps javanica]
MEPSGADKGFFQTPPTLPNQFYDDDSHKRCFKLFLPESVASQTREEVAALGQDVLSDQVFTWISDAYRNLPYLKGSGRSSFGHYTGELVTGEGWRELQNMGISKGIVATGYDTPYGPFSRPLQFLRMHLWQPSSAIVTCPSAMQDGAACLLRRHLTDPSLSARLTPDERRVYEDAYRRLTSRDPAVAWTSGQWMTERTGGSDVSLTETVATRPANAEFGLASQQGGIPLGPWSISGFKWFSSATDSKMTVLLARTSAADGRLSAFVAPMRRHDPHATTMAGHARPDGERLNGVRISRLKHKFGTQSLPTAELVLEGMRGWLVGEEGKGIQEIGSVLTITRVYSAVSAVSYVGRALAIAKAFARVREVGAGNRARMRLIHSPLHMRTLARMTGEYRGLMLLSLYAAYVLGVSEYPNNEYDDVAPALKALTPDAKLALPLIRVLSQVTKAYVCKPSVSLVFSCMEALGGVGYMDNEEQEYLNVSRIFRDVSVLPIWEGTTDVLSTDTIRALKHPKAGQHCIAALDDVIGKAAVFSGKSPKGWDAVQEWTALRAKIVNTAQADLMGEARDLVWVLGDILVSLLLYVDAASDGDAAAQEILARFVEQKYNGVEKRERQDTASELRKDALIVYGDDDVGAAPPKL